MISGRLYPPSKGLSEPNLRGPLNIISEILQTWFQGAHSLASGSHRHRSEGASGSSLRGPPSITFRDSSSLVSGDPSLDLREAMTFVLETLRA